MITSNGKAVFQNHYSTLNNIDVGVRERKMAWKLVTAVTAATLLARKLLKAKRKKEEKGKGLYNTAVSSLISGSFYLFAVDYLFIFCFVG